MLSFGYLVSYKIGKFVMILGVIVNYIFCGI